MVRIILRRFREVLLFLLAITFISFFIIRLAPGDPVLTILNVDEISVTQEQVEALREEMGFNDPFLVQYGLWIVKIITLDFGNSYITNQPVMDVLLAGLPATIELTIGSLLVMLLIALPIGTLSALYRNKWIDKISRVLSSLGSATPSFWLGLILIDLFAVRLHWFPTMGRDSFLSLVLPSLTVGLAMSGVYVRLLRSSLIESMGQDFILAARSRGIAEIRIFFSHIWRQSLPPVITVFGLSFGSLIGGLVVVEVLFAYPGIGKLVVESIRQRDYPLIQGYILLMAITVFVVNTCVDISYRYITPQLRGKGRKGS